MFCTKILKMWVCVVSEWWVSGEGVEIGEWRVCGGVCVVSVCGECAWWVCVVSVWWMCVVSVWWMCVVSVVGECVWWVCVVGVWWVYVVSVGGECACTTHLARQRLLCRIYSVPSTLHDCCSYAGFAVYHPPCMTAALVQGLQCTTQPCMTAALMQGLQCTTHLA